MTASKLTDRNLKDLSRLVPIQTWARSSDARRVSYLFPCCCSELHDDALPALTELDVSCNRFGADGIADLGAKLITVAPNLKKLDMYLIE